MSSRSIVGSLLFATWVAALAASPAALAGGGSPATPVREVFVPADFAAAAPANAYDMVERLPGFVLVEADEDIRGYAAALGNVLIDGARPASKRDELETLLERIPAASVERIELIRSGGDGVDMAGHAMLANVVRRRDPAAEMAIEAGVALASDGWAAPVGALEYARQWGERSLELNLSADAEPDEDGGDGHVSTTAPDGSELERARSDSRSITATRDASLHWRQPWAGGRLDVDAVARQETLDFDGTRHYEGADPAANEATREDEDLREAEAALRWTRTLAGGATVTTLASGQQGRLDARETSIDEDGIERFEEDTRTGESLANAMLDWETDGGLKLSSGLELAYNTLDSRARLVENGEEVALPGSRVGVREQRGEGSFGVGWQQADWQLEASLRVEASQLRQDGDSLMSRHFTYFKPRFAAVRDFGRHTLRWSLARDVGQLDFGDFVASASLDDDEVAAGNAGLEPDKTWRSALTWEQEFGADGTLVLTWYHDRIQDVVDRVPVLAADGEIFDAPGNIGDGRRDSLALEFGSSLAAFSLPDVRLSATVLWQHSSVRDPSTGESRGISEEKPVEGELELEHVLPGKQLSWGLSVGLAERETEYRYDQVTDDYEGRSWELFVERRLAGGWRLRAELSDPEGLEVSSVRHRYDGLRAPDTLEEIESRRHRTPALLMLTVRRDIGG